MLEIQDVIVRWVCAVAGCIILHCLVWGDDWPKRVDRMEKAGTWRPGTTFFNTFDKVLAKKRHVYLSNGARVVG